MNNRKIAEKYAKQWHGDADYEWRIKGLTEVILSAILDATTTHDPDQTPPEIHDAEWALKYAIKKCLILNFSNDSVVNQNRKKEVFWKYETPVKTVEEGIDLILKYKLKYDSDKVEPEETAMGLLREAFAHCKFPESLRDRVYTFFFKTDCADKGSEADRA